MKISFGTRLSHLGSINSANGYGYATDNMLKSLSRLGYHVEPNDSSADVEIWFDQPHHWNFSKGPYKIGYHPWESTELLPGWADIMNECDEIWTPSPLIAQWYKKYAGVKVPVYVYEHGVEHEPWAPIKREVTDTINFLHVGAEATRKGGWDTVRAFRTAFPRRRDVSLTMKMINSSWHGIPSLGKVNYMNTKYSLDKLAELFRSHHVYVYPSFGEGFGLTPLQAIATGMPTITLPGWAPYSEFLDPALNIGHQMIDSPWPKIHPGKMMQPSMDDIVLNMRFVADNYDLCLNYAESMAKEVHEKYDWDTLTKQAFEALEGRII